MESGLFLHLPWLMVNLCIGLLIVNWLFTLSEHQLSKPKCCSFHFFNAGHTLEDLWSKLSNEFHQGLFDKCNITFQVSICICWYWQLWSLQQINIVLLQYFLLLLTAKFFTLLFEPFTDWSWSCFDLHKLSLQHNGKCPILEWPTWSAMFDVVKITWVLYIMCYRSGKFLLQSEIWFRKWVMLFILMDKFCVGMVVKLLSCKYCWGHLVLCLFSLVSILFCWHWASGTVYIWVW